MSPWQRSVCTQYQIYYSCGHRSNNEFVRCPAHAKTTNRRCKAGVWEYKDDRYAPKKCRLCLNSP